MAKSSNPLDEYKRKQRKKEKLKNKTKRISERDAKVAETASLSSVQSEIQKLTKTQEHQNGHLDNKDTRKLERLRKELKIVQAAEEERKKKREELAKLEWEETKKRMKTKEGVDELNQNKFRKAKASIYYDPIMNPFGAPPPGQPMLYHSRGGGKTMDLDAAFVPYDLRDESDDKSVDLDIKENIQNDSNGQSMGQQERNLEVKVEAHTETEIEIETERERIISQQPLPPCHPQHFSRNVYQPPRDSKPPPPPPPPRAPPPPPRAPPPLPLSIPPPPPPKESCPPTLPEASDCVKRLQRQKGNKSKKSSAMADIWASQDEIKYEGGLEGAIDLNGNLQDGHSSSSKQKFHKKRKVEREDVYDPLCPADQGYSEYRSKDQIQRSTRSQKKTKVQEDGVGNATKIKEKARCQWYYIDQSGTTQGPFQSEQMIGWSQAGFFPNEIMVRNGQNGDFAEMGVVDLSTGGLKKEVRIAMLKQSIHDQKQSIQERPLESIEDRIAALKQIVVERPVESVEDRIAALKETMQERPPESIEDRIAALKNDKAEHQSDGGEEAKVEMPTAAKGTEAYISVDDEVEPPSYPAEDAPSYPVLGGDGPPSYPAYPVDGNDEVPAYSVDRDDEVPAYPLDANIEPPSYPVGGNDEVVAYPIDENDETPSYPVDENDGVPAYPIDDNEKDISYPVDEYDDVPAYSEDIPYPTEDIPYPTEDVPYPTDVAYPIGDEYAYPNTDDAYNSTGGEMVAPYYIPDTSTDGGNNNSNGKTMGTVQNNKEQKSVFKGDKEVIGIVPANLQVRRNIKAKPKPMKRRKKTPTPTLGPGPSAPQSKTEVKNGGETSTSKTISDDYEKFMSEISSLKNS